MEQNLIENPVIKVFGVGGGGTNAIGHIIKREFEGAELYCVNTDIQSLRSVNGCPADHMIQIGKESTQGLGAGSQPEVGRAAAEESLHEISDAVKGADILFIAAGLGGGTGTGAAPVIAKTAKEQGILTVAVVTKPFSFEGNKRMSYALEGIEELKQYVDSIVVIPNQKLLEKLDNSIILLHAFDAVNEVLYTAVSGISDLILKDGMINVDFADVKTVMGSKGLAIMGQGQGIGEAGDDRAVQAVLQATTCPLLDDIDISNAEGLIVSIVSGMDLQLEELNIIGAELRKITSENATIKVGNSFDLDMQKKIEVTVIATGLKSKHDAVQSKPESPFKVESRKAQYGETSAQPKQRTNSGSEIPSFLTQKSA
ncbi:cell division protein FtsZ [Photobacterium galatheae]|uniref:Cell division protein FtsZ n=1 Tax=Photobacterium galatheae TaxID=1654360 RepID=A0A066RK58_9GAMM|nr:cell division protein FtsZ [Photobacterium galatheae]KDM90825.1 hypothetical protein EA58_13775 [Photobacterium galatheae]MCM0149207.1 cell division protein FtsZ [Photobacterium galatheae]